MQQVASLAQEIIELQLPIDVVAAFLNVGITREKLLITMKITMDINLT